jgi:NAD dependent epimerase/dehydratase family enzyme
MRWWYSVGIRSAPGRCRPACFPIPALALNLVLGEMSAVLLTGQQAVPKRLLEEGFAFQFPDVEAELQNLPAEGK